ncbi:hypothetical protein D3C73_1392610 [compost metagenome]
MQKVSAAVSLEILSDIPELVESALADGYEPLVRKLARAVFEAWDKTELCAATRALFCMPLYATIVIAAKIPMITITIRSSTIVKPVCFFASMVVMIITLSFWVFLIKHRR